MSKIDSPPITFYKLFNSELSTIEVWFTDQDSSLLEIEYRVTVTLALFNRLYESKTYYKTVDTS